MQTMLKLNVKIICLLYDKIKEFYFKGKNKIHFSNYITSVKAVRYLGRVNTLSAVKI